MKKFLLIIVNIAINFLKPSSLRKKFLFRLKVVKMFLAQNECERYSDCFLLQEIIEFIPRVSDRHFEYPWVIENINIKDGELLDVGSTYGEFLVDKLPKNLRVTALNLNTVSNKGRAKFVEGDIRKTNFSSNYFDAITCISTLEHIGVKGRYNSDDDPVGDKKAIKEIHRILKKDATLFLTVPYGLKDVLPINKLYNKRRIKNLFDGLFVYDIEYKKYDKKYGFWLSAKESEVAENDMLLDGWYALCFIKAKKV